MDSMSPVTWGADVKDAACEEDDDEDDDENDIDGNDEEHDKSYFRFAA